MEPKEFTPDLKGNTRVTGASLAHFIKKLNQILGLKFSNIHLIGHSLGIGRITGLDPAGPRFHENISDPSVSSYIAVIYTDYRPNLIEGFALLDPLGEIDFYPNTAIDNLVVEN
uniref:Lipase domain-containing protein n=1 Tax=Tetranychus urticae TaxID=32264 RepID=T1KXM3_TETUR